MSRPKRQRKERRGQRDMSLPFQEWRFEVGAPDHGARLDGFLAGKISWRTRSAVQRVISAGRVRVLPFKDPQQAAVGQPRAGLKLRAGQEVVLTLPAPRFEAGVGPAPPLAIRFVHEDEHLLAVDKPAHLNVYPTRRHRAGSLIERVHERCRELGGAGALPPTLCHRLDRETSGLVLFAKDAGTRAAIGRLFEERRLEKVYLAVVEGEPEGEEGRIELPLGPAAGSRVELRVGVRRDDGRPAVTAWKLRRRLGGRALVELSPETGRQHQLRAHLAAIGHPIVGDKLYLGGDETFLRSLEGALPEDESDRLGLDRQALHCWRLRFEHPATGVPLDLEAPLPPDLAELAGEI